MRPCLSSRSKLIAQLLSLFSSPGREYLSGFGLGCSSHLLFFVVPAESSRIRLTADLMELLTRSPQPDVRQSIKHKTKTHITYGYSDAENERKIAHAGFISEFQYEVGETATGLEVVLAKRISMQVLAGLLFTLACLSVAGRIVTRVYTRRRLFLDDAFLIFALACLCGASVLCFQMLRTLFLFEALIRSSAIVVPNDQYRPLLRAWAVSVSYFCLTWTTMFGVKFSFLALFWNLIQHVSQRLLRYYWTVVGTCVVVWMFVICEPFIQCHYFGIHSGRVSFSQRLGASADDMASKMPLDFAESPQHRTVESDSHT